MKKIGIFKFEVFDESIKERAMEVAGKFPGVTKVVEVEGEGQLVVWGEFSISELTNELKNIDESVKTIKFVPDGVTGPEIQQQDEGERPINIEKASKPLSDDASSSNWIGSQENGLWEQVKVVGAGAAGQAKDIGVAAAQKAVRFGVGAVRLLPSNKKWYYGNNDNEKEIRAEAQRLKEQEMERNKIRQKMEEARKRKQAEEEKRQKRIREEKEAENLRKKGLADAKKREKKWKEEEKRRQQAIAEEVKKQNKIKQEKEEEKRRKRVLAEEEKRQNKIKQEEDEKRRKHASENNSGGTSMVAGITGGLWTYAVSKLTNASGEAIGTGQPNTSTTQTQRTRQPNSSTYTQGTGRPSTWTQNPSTQRGNTSS